MNQLASTAAKVLVIEDDAALSEVLTYNLTREKYEVKSCNDGGQGLTLARNELPDLVILDLMLPTMDGIEICRELRSDDSTKHTAILMLTAKTEETDEIVGFSVGADDYVTKPFSVKVLLQRVRALLNRRRQQADPADTLRMHGITVDLSGHEVFCNDEKVQLTPTEYRLLVTLMRRPGRAFSRVELVRSAIGDDTYVLDRTIDVHIRSLRLKLKDIPNVVETVRSIGYRFSRQPSNETADNINEG